MKIGACAIMFANTMVKLASWDPGLRLSGVSLTAGSRAGGGGLGPKAREHYSHIRTITEIRKKGESGIYRTGDN